MLPNYDGGFIESENNETLKFMYIKMSGEDETYNPVCNFNLLDDCCKKQYITAIFKDGRDFIGYTTLLDLKNLIDKRNFISILDNDYSVVKNVYGDVTEYEYDKTKLFILQQINHLEEKAVETSKKYKKHKRCCFWF